MSKNFRPWKIDEAQLLPPSVQDYVAKDHLSRLIVTLVREELDLFCNHPQLHELAGQPPFDPRLMTALLLHGYASGIYSSRRIARGNGPAASSALQKFQVAHGRDGSFSTFENDSHVRFSPKAT